MTIRVLILCLFQFYLNTHAQLIIKENIPISDMVDYVVKGNRIEITNSQFIGNRAAIGLYKTRAKGVNLSEGIVMSTGIVRALPGPNKATDSSNRLQQKGDKDLEKVIDSPTFDATVLTIDFIPQQEVIYFKYHFASEEYNEYVGSSFNDGFAFFIIDSLSGEKINMAVTPNTGDMISVNSINNQTNSNSFHSNELDIYRDPIYGQIEFDGITKALVAFAKVVPGKAYTLKMVIADASDNIYDSGVFIEAHSFQSCSKEEFLIKNEDFFLGFEMDSTSMTQHYNELAQIGSSANNFDGESTTEVIPSIRLDEKPSSENEKPSSENEKPFSLYFNFDSYQLSAKSKNEIESYLKLKEPTTIIINAFTDATGSSSYNKKLSLKRALAVKNYITSLGYKVKEANANGIDFSNISDEQKRRVDLIIQ